MNLLTFLYDKCLSRFFFIYDRRGLMRFEFISENVVVAKILVYIYVEI